MNYDPIQFAEKYRLAVQTANDQNPEKGICGFEVEWNLLNSKMQPVLGVGAGPVQQQFVDYLMEKCLPEWVLPVMDLEAFKWMIEYSTNPYYHLFGALYESRLLEGVLINAMHKAGRDFGERLYLQHGSLFYPISVDHDSVPSSWPLAKRRYVERCVDMFGEILGTAGIHTNLSFPEPLLAWDFMHLSQNERRNYGHDLSLPVHIDDYTNEVYITQTRLLRAFAALFIAISASTPIRGEWRDDEPVAVLTDFNSVRSMTFPNPIALDVPNLYRSYNDYMQISYDLVKKGIRFGNNNWAPIRARSLQEKVDRLIDVSSDQLKALYARGLYSSHPSSSTDAVEETANQIETQNLLARIDLPMARAEIRTDESGHSLEMDIANLTFRHTLFLHLYADPDFGRAFRFDAEDVTRARKNEDAAARDGLQAEIANPLTGKPVAMRDFLNWTLSEIRPLAEALEQWEPMTPLVEMAAGAPNTAEKIRTRLRAELGDSKIVPVDLLRTLAEERESEVARDIETIIASLPILDQEANKIKSILRKARNDVRQNPHAPICFRPSLEALTQIKYSDITSEIVDLSSHLIRIPSVTACPDERLDEVHRAAGYIFDYLQTYGLKVKLFNQSKYPAVLAEFPDTTMAPVMLCGHFDVVAPEPDDSQFEPRLEGDYLWGRGSADMKTVVATYLVWMKEMLRLGPPYPPLILALIGNEENGEGEPVGTSDILKHMEQDAGYIPGLMIVGERTGEQGDELWGKICTENRGMMRFEILGYGQQKHSGLMDSSSNLEERLFTAKNDLAEVFQRHLTLESPDGWQSQVRFPFIQIGTPEIYNITAGYGVLGVEIRSIPQDNLEDFQQGLRTYCQKKELELKVTSMENGIACDLNNPYFISLMDAVRQASGKEPRLGRKLPGSSARFAPGGLGVVWGQSGIAPHGGDERHFIPSILPYYQALMAYGELLKNSLSGG